MQRIPVFPSDPAFFMPQPERGEGVICPPDTPGWRARLALDYRLEGGRCLLRHRHEGPLRVLKSLYPEGEAICHNVLVHPPSGLVAGDRLEIELSVGEGAHAYGLTPHLAAKDAAAMAFSAAEIPTGF